MSAIEERATEEWTGIGPDKRGTYLFLRADEISVSKNVRKAFDDDRLKELAESLKEYGVLQPLVVRRLEGKYGPAYELVAGERRLRAAKIAGLDKVPCRVVDLTAKQAAEVQLLENLQRQDLNPMEEAQALSDLMSEHGYTQEQLAAKLGKSQPWVASRTKLLTLPEKAAGLITRGIMSPSHGEALSPYVKAVPESVERIVSKFETQSIPVARLRDELEEDIRRHYRPVHCGYCGYHEKALFDVGPCQSCAKTIRVKPYAHSDVKPDPWCTDVKCWETKQTAAKEALVSPASDVVDTKKLKWDEFERFSGGRAWSDCTLCPSLKIDQNGHNVCLNPKCYRKHTLADEKAAQRTKEEQWRAQVDEIVAECRRQGLVNAFLQLPRRLQVYLAGSILLEFDPSYDFKSREWRREKLGWDKGAPETREAKGTRWQEFAETLHLIPAEKLAEYVFEWLALDRVTNAWRGMQPLEYLLGMKLTADKAEDEEQELDDIDDDLDDHEEADPND